MKKLETTTNIPAYCYTYALNNPLLYTDPTGNNPAPPPQEDDEYWRTGGGLRQYSSYYTNNIGRWYPGYSRNVGPTYREHMLSKFYTDIWQATPTAGVATFIFGTNTDETYTNMTFKTIRNKIIKTAALVRELKTKIKIELPRCCPTKSIQSNCLEMFSLMRV